jgi:tripartite-type tricarboxylate transporter receptor subunit TctC
MMNSRHSRRSLMAGAAASLAAPRLARAQEPRYPTQSIRFVSPYPPGGGTDVTARIMSPAMGEFLGQPIVVDNRPGAAGAIGAAEVARAAPDGYTVLVDALGHVVNPFVLRGLNFDYASFVPVSQLTLLAQAMVTSPSTPGNDLAGFIAYAKSRGGSLAYASSGTATGSQLASVLFLREAGLDLVHVPYRGGSAVLPDVIAGNVAFAFSTVNTATNLVLEGRLKALAIASDQRVAALPNVPTMAEAGFPAVVVDEWNGMFCPPGTPRRIVDRLYAGVRHTLQIQAVKDRFAATGARIVGSNPEEFARFVAERLEATGRLVREAQITVD